MAVRPILTVVALAAGLLVASAPAALGAPARQGDFNGDGFVDLAIGIPGENVGGIVGAGAVSVLYGGPAGVSARGDQFWHQNVESVPDDAETGDRFGESLAAGDFDGDGFSDLAVGIPFEDVGAVANAGAVIVLYGSRTGLAEDRAQFWDQDVDGVEDAAEPGDNLGSSLTAANFGKSSQADLAVGVPFEDVGAVASAGAVNVLYGSSTGLTATGDQFFHQDSPGVNDAAEAGDRFGWSLAAANFGKSSHADLAVGVVFELVGDESFAGAVTVLYGSSTGLTAAGNRFFHQDSPGVNDAAEAADRFGWSLAAANFGKSSHADLAVGVPLEDVGGVANAGAVNVLYGSSTGLTATGDQFLHQDSSGVNDTAEAGDFFGSSLAAANFGKSSHADLAVGVPREGVGAVASAGAVNVLYGSSTGLTAAGDQFFRQGSSGVNDAAEANDEFGSSLAAANFGKSSHADLAVGVPFEDVGGVVNAGAVNVLYGSSTGLTATGNQFWHQDSPGVLDAAEANDQFGGSLGPRR
jgi:hypothetical protein